MRTSHSTDGRCWYGDLAARSEHSVSERRARVCCRVRGSRGPVSVCAGGSRVEPHRNRRLLDLVRIATIRRYVCVEVGTVAVERFPGGNVDVGGFRRLVVDDSYEAEVTGSSPGSAHAGRRRRPNGVCFANSCAEPGRGSRTVQLGPHVVVDHVSGHRGIRRNGLSLRREQNRLTRP